MPPETISKIPTGLTTEGLLGRRYMARGLDTVVILLIFAVLVLLYAVVHNRGTGPDGAATFFLRIVALSLVWMGYGTVLESSPWQATVGKKLLGLRVYNAQGGRLTLIQAAGRNLIKDGPFLVLGLLPGLYLLTWVLLALHVICVHRSAVSQAIHDRLVNTWVAAPEPSIRLHLT